MQNTEQRKEEKGSALPNGSTSIKETGMQETGLVRRENRTAAVLPARPILVSEQQFATAREEISQSLSLLNASGEALLQALKSIPPHAESGRAMGEYSAQMMRQLSKSICDIVQTKTTVIRQVYSIARDEI